MSIRRLCSRLGRPPRRRFPRPALRRRPHPLPVRLRRRLPLPSPRAPPCRPSRALCPRGRSNIPSATARLAHRGPSTPLAGAPHVPVRRIRPPLRPRRGTPHRFAPGPAAPRPTRCMVGLAVPRRRARRTVGPSRVASPAPARETRWPRRRRHARGASPGAQPGAARTSPVPPWRRPSRRVSRRCSRSPGRAESAAGPSPTTLV
jgi:hypothetical protein